MIRLIAFLFIAPINYFIGVLFYSKYIDQGEPVAGAVFMAIMSVLAIYGVIIMFMNLFSDNPVEIYCQGGL